MRTLTRMNRGMLFTSSCTCGRLQLKNLFLRSFVLPNTHNAGLGHQVSFKAQMFNFAM